MFKNELFEQHFENIEKVLDWWEFDGSGIEGDNLMESLSVSLNAIKKEVRECQKKQTQSQ